MLRTPRLAWGKAGVGLWSQNRVIEAGAGRTQDDRPIAAYKGTTDSAVAWIPVASVSITGGTWNGRWSPSSPTTMALWGLASSKAGSWNVKLRD